MGTSSEVRCGCHLASQSALSCPTVAAASDCARRPSGPSCSLTAALSWRSTNCASPSSVWSTAYSLFRSAGSIVCCTSTLPAGIGVESGIFEKLAPMPKTRSASVQQLEGRLGARVGQRPGSERVVFGEGALARRGSSRRAPGPVPQTRVARPKPVPRAPPVRRAAPACRRPAAPRPRQPRRQDRPPTGAPRTDW